jgi:pyruvate ferredoxin oxidoreductase alpha subunit
MHALYEIDHGITKITYDPEKRGRKIPVTDAFSKMGGAFRHLGSPDFGWLAQQVQQEVDRRWERLKALAGHALL